MAISDGYQQVLSPLSVIDLEHVGSNTFNYQYLASMGSKTVSWHNVHYLLIRELTQYKTRGCIQRALLP